jgi:hypothetical protein
MTAVPEQTLAPRLVREPASEPLETPASGRYRERGWLVNVRAPASRESGSPPRSQGFHELGGFPTMALPPLLVGISSR